jgi:hypothetical protein
MTKLVTTASGARLDFDALIARAAEAKAPKKDVQQRGSEVAPKKPRPQAQVRLTGHIPAVPNPDPDPEPMAEDELFPAKGKKEAKAEKK